MWDYYRVLDSLPAANYTVLRHVFWLLSHFAENADMNSMNAYNISVCISPSILWPETSMSTVRNEVPPLIEFIIDRCQEVFSPELPIIFRQGEEKRLVRVQSEGDGKSKWRRRKGVGGKIRNSTSSTDMDYGESTDDAATSTLSMQSNDSTSEKLVMTAHLKSNSGPAIVATKSAEDLDVAMVRRLSRGLSQSGEEQKQNTQSSSDEFQHPRRLPTMVTQSACNSLERVHDSGRFGGNSFHTTGGGSMPSLLDTEENEDEDEDDDDDDDEVSLRRPFFTESPDLSSYSLDSYCYPTSPPSQLVIHKRQPVAPPQTTRRLPGQPPAAAAANTRLFLDDFDASVSFLEHATAVVAVAILCSADVYRRRDGAVGGSESSPRERTRKTQRNDRHTSDWKRGGGGGGGATTRQRSDEREWRRAKIAAYYNGDVADSARRSANAIRFHHSRDGGGATRIISG